MISRVKPVIDYTVRKLCYRSYPNHKKGCPNFGKKEGCPPVAPYFDEVIDLSRDVYAIYTKFNFFNHVEKMKIKHSDWSQRQLECCLYWQGTARKNLRSEIKRFMSVDEWKPLPVFNCPEAMGINVTETMKQIGIHLEWPPVNFTYQVALAGSFL